MDFLGRLRSNNKQTQSLPSTFTRVDNAATYHSIPIPICPTSCPTARQTLITPSKPPHQHSFLPTAPTGVTKPAMGIKDRLLRRASRRPEAAAPLPSTGGSTRSLGLRSRRSQDTRPSDKDAGVSVVANGAELGDSAPVWRRRSSVDRALAPRRLSSEPVAPSKPRQRRWGVGRVSLPGEGVVGVAGDGETRAGYAGDRPDASSRMRRGEGGDGDVGEYKDDDEFSSQASTHASRDPFLNDNASIPASSVGDFEAVRGANGYRIGRGDEEDFEVGGVLGPDFFAQIADGESLVKATVARKDRDRSRDRDRGPHARRSWASGPAKNKPPGGEDESFLSGGGGGVEYNSVGGGGNSAASGHGSFGSGPAFGAARSGGLEASGEDDTFQPASGHGLDAAGRNSVVRSAFSKGASISAVSSRNSGVSMRRRSAVWRAQSVDKEGNDAEMFDQPSHEKAVLDAVILCDVAAKESSPPAAERLVDVFDSEVVALDDALAAARDSIARARKLALALPTARGEEYEEMLYGDAPGNETASSQLARADAETTFQGFRLMEAVWDIEAAVFERQWYDAVDMIETLRAANADVLTLGSGSRSIGGQDSGSASSAATDRFARARKEFCAVVDRLATDLLSVTCDRENGRSSCPHASLLARLGLQQEAQRAVLSAGASALEQELTSQRRAHSPDVIGEQCTFVATVGARLLAQLCESYTMLAEVSGIDKTSNDAAFMTWSVGLVDSVYDKYVGPCIDSRRVDIFETSKLVSALRNSTVAVPPGEIFEEVGVVLDTRLFALVREETCMALVRYQDAFAERAEAAGSQPIDEWESIPLRSSEPIMDELGQFVRLVAIDLLGIDNGMDSLLASTMTVACGVYAANVLHVVEITNRSTPYEDSLYGVDQFVISTSDVHAKRSEKLAYSVRLTLQSVGEALATAASVDHILRSNAGVSWMSSQLRAGAACGAEGLRKMGIASVPLRPRQGLAAPARVWGDAGFVGFGGLYGAGVGGVEGRTGVGMQAMSGVAERWRHGPTDEAAARDIARAALAKERRCNTLIS